MTIRVTESQMRMVVFESAEFLHDYLKRPSLRHLGASLSEHEIMEIAAAMTERTIRSLKLDVAIVAEGAAHDNLNDTPLFGEFVAEFTEARERNHDGSPPS